MPHYFFKEDVLISVKNLEVNRQKEDIQQHYEVNVPLSIKPILLQEYVAILLVFSFTATDNSLKKFLAYSSEPLLLTRLTERENLWLDLLDMLLNSVGKENDFFLPLVYEWANKTAALCEKNNTPEKKMSLH